MSELLGAVYILIGLACMSLAVMTPARSQTSAGLLLTVLFAASAMERIAAGYFRLVDAPLTEDHPSARILVWAVLELAALIAIAAYAWQMPQEKPPKKPRGREKR